MTGNLSFPEALMAPPDARFALLATRFHAALVQRLVDGARAALRARGVLAQRVELVEVPGAWELPLAAAWLARGGRHAAIVAMGCVVRGDTRHFEHVADECARGLMQVQLDTGVPVCNAVLAVERMADAEARAGGSAGNKGAEAAEAAVAMAVLAAAQALPRRAGAERAA